MFKLNGKCWAILVIALCVIVSLSALAPQAVQAAKHAIISSATTIPVAELGLFEDRFFSRQYVNDPAEKRLERL